MLARNAGFGRPRISPIGRTDSISAPISELQRAVLGALCNDAEPTWIVVQDPDVPGDRESVLAALRDLEARNLVHSVIAESAQTGRESANEDCLALTDECWDLVVLIESPRYA
jgi:hypothetical protein